MKMLATLLLSLAVFNVNAGFITFSDRATFDGQFSGLSIEDFEDVNSIDEVLASTNITSGLTLSLTEGIDAYLAPPGQSFNETTAIGVNQPRDGGWVMDFSVAVNTVSFDVFQNNGGGSQFGGNILADVNVFGVDGLLGTFSASIPSGAAGFFGVVSDSDLITSVTVNATSSFDVLDNVAFGEASAVPEPFGLALLGLGLAALRLSRKRNV